MRCDLSLLHFGVWFFVFCFVYFSYCVHAFYLVSAFSKVGTLMLHDCCISGIFLSFFLYYIVIYFVFWPLILLYKKVFFFCIFKVTVSEVHQGNDEWLVFPSFFFFSFISSHFFDGFPSSPDLHRMEGENELRNLSRFLFNFFFLCFFLYIIVYVCLE